MRRWLRSTLPVFALCAAAGLLTAPAANAQGKVPVADTQPVWASPTNLAGADPNADQVVFSVWLGGAETVSSTAPWPTSTIRRRRPSTSGSRLASSMPASRRRRRRGGRAALALVGGLLDRGRAREPALRGRRGLGRTGRAGVRRRREHVPRRRLSPARAEPRPGRARRRRAARQRDHRPRRCDDARPPERRHAPAAARRHVRRAVLELLGPAHLVGLHEPVRVRPRCRGSSAATSRPRSTRHTGSTGCTPPGSTAAGRRSRSPARSSRRRSARTSRTSRTASAWIAVTAPTTTARPASTTARSSHRDEAVPEEPGRDAELVHRAGARRRVGTRRRAAGEDRLRRRLERRPRARPGPELRGRHARRRRHLELVGPAGGVRLARRDHGAELRVPAGGGAGHRRLLRLGRRRRQPRGRRRALGGLPRLEPVGHLGRRHRAWASARTASTCGRPAGARRRPTGTTTTGSPPRRAPFLYGSGGGASHVFAMPAYQAAEVPPSEAMWNGKLRRSEPDSRWSPTPRPA